MKFNNGILLNDKTWQDVLLPYHVLFGGSWLYDKDIIHYTKTNKDSFFVKIVRSHLYNQSNTSLSMTSHGNGLGRVNPSHPRPECFCKFPNPMRVDIALLSPFQNIPSSPIPALAPPLSSRPPLVAKIK